MPKITVQFPDGRIKVFSQPINLREIAPKEVIAAKINGMVTDLNTEVKQDSDVELLTFKNPEGKEVFRHSSAHVLAHAIKHLYPKAKNTIGPPVEEGFYYDFGDLSIKEEDFKKIEREMHDICKGNHTFEKTVLTIKKVKEMFKDNKYKIEIAEEAQKAGQELTAYQDGDFIDLCEGPHILSTGCIKAVKLMKIAGAYWRGDKNKAQLQRIYGVSFPSKEELKEHLRILEEAGKRDHKKIGQRMELFAQFDLIGKGLPVWLPNGDIIRREIEKFAIEMEDKAGYVRVSTPHLAKKELFEMSGHLPYYEETMYPAMRIDDGTYYLKAMNCPLHHLIYSMKPRSYRELPLRLAEYGTVYRNELSGTLSGLLRVRMLQMNDAHIYCTKEQLKDEIEAVLKMIKEYFRVFNFSNYWFRLSLGEIKNKKKYIEDPESWKYSEEVLRDVLRSLKIRFVEAKDEAAFYGPKIDAQFKNVHGREETMSTVQLDFAAKKRFKLSYIDEKSNKNPEVFVIHRAPLSTHERLISFLIEHYTGKFPLWLSPEQVRILTVSEKFDKYANEVADKLKDGDIRVSVDKRAESVSKKVREAQLAHVNYILVVGEKEVDSNTINVRTRNNVIHGAMKVNALFNKLVEEIKQKQ